MNTRFGFVVMASLGLLGCGSKSSAPPPVAAVEAPRRIEYQWVTTPDGAELRAEGSSQWVLRVTPARTATHVSVEALLPFSVGATEFKDVRGKGRIKVEVLPWLGDLDIDALRDGQRSLEAWKKKTPATTRAEPAQPRDWQVPVEAWLSPDGSQRWKGRLPPFIVEPLVAGGALSGGGPLVFNGDDAAPERPDTLYVNFQFGRPLNPLLGTGRTLRDVDWIAVSTWRPTGKLKKCGGYGRIPGVRGNTVVSVSLDETEVRVIDRRTGAVLGTRVFPPQNTCPGAVTGTTAAVGASTDVIIAWLEQQLAAGRVSASK